MTTKLIHNEGKQSNNVYLEVTSTIYDTSHFSNGTLKVNRLERRTEAIMSGSRSVPVCMFIIKCSNVVQSKLNIILPLPTLNIMQYANEIKVLYTIL